MPSFCVKLDDEPNHICHAIEQALALRQKLAGDVPQNQMLLLFNGRRLPLNGTREMILDAYWATLPHHVSQPKPRFGA